MKRQYRPDLSVKFAPRVPRRLRSTVNAICRACDMPEADVLRYSFEAAVHMASRRQLKLLDPLGDPRLDAMLTLRTSKAVAKKVRDLHVDRFPKLLQADVLRRLLEAILPIARAEGMAHVLRLRERALTSDKGRSGTLAGEEENEPDHD